MNEYLQPVANAFGPFWLPLWTVVKIVVIAIPLILAGLRSLYWTRYDMWAAGSMLTVVPVMLIYAFASKWFIRGIAMTGIKG